MHALPGAPGGGGNKKPPEGGLEYKLLGLVALD
jgi:hypothetical protein